MGGISRLSRLSAVKVKGVATLTMPEQSGPFQGPWLLNTVELDEHYGFADLEYKAASRLRSPQQVQPIPLNYKVSFLKPGQGGGGSSLFTSQELFERLAFDPARLLLFAKLAPDARVGADGRSVSFPLANEDVTLRFDRRSGFLSSIETISAREGFWGCWGDVKSETFLGNWQLTPEGVCLPAWWSMSRNGIRVADFAYASLEPEFDPKLTLQDVRAQYLTMKNRPAAEKRLPPIDLVEIAPSLGQYRLMFPTEVFVQREGLYVVDPSYDTLHGERILADLTRRYPKRPVAGVIVTDPYWIHFGGLRAFARRGIPVYCAEGNVPQLRAFCAAPVRKSGETPVRNVRFVPIRASLKIGGGPEGLRIAVLPGPETDRMLAIYSPGSRILFASDTIVFGGSSLFSNEAAREVVRTVEEQGWTVDRVFATHNPLVSWSRVLDALPKG